eukprot:g60360.t1
MGKHRLLSITYGGHVQRFKVRSGTRAKDLKELVRAAFELPSDARLILTDRDGWDTVLDASLDTGDYTLLLAPAPAALSSLSASVASAVPASAPPSLWQMCAARAAGPAASQCALVLQSPGAEQAARTLSWAELARLAKATALMLLKQKLRPGHVLVASLPSGLDSLLLELACQQLGVLMVCLDLSLAGTEVIRTISLLQAKAFAFLGLTKQANFTALGQAVNISCPSVKLLLHFCAAEEQLLAGALQGWRLRAAALEMMQDHTARAHGSKLLKKYNEVVSSCSPDAPCLGLLRAGSAGTEVVIWSQRAFALAAQHAAHVMQLSAHDRLLLSLPLAHPAAQAMQLGPAFAAGAALILSASAEHLLPSHLPPPRTDTSPAAQPTVWIETATGWAELCKSEKKEKTSRQKLAVLVASSVQELSLVDSACLQTMRSCGAALAQALCLLETSGLCAWLSEPEAFLLGRAIGLPLQEVLSSARAHCAITVRSAHFQQMGEQAQGKAWRASSVTDPGQPGLLCFQGDQCLSNLLCAQNQLAYKQTVSLEGVVYSALVVRLDPASGLLHLC